MTPNLFVNSCTRGVMKLTIAWLVLMLLFLGCARELPLGQAACPCVTGWVCCAAQSVCARSVDACPQPMLMSITPARASIATGRRQQFVAADASWRVEEVGGGTIDTNGLYLAPDVPGTFHVVAAAPGWSDTRAEVTVRPLSLDLVAGQYGGRTDTPVDGIGAAARFSRPEAMAMDDAATYVIDTPFTGPSSLDYRNPVSVVRRIDRRSAAVETLVYGSSGDSLVTGSESWALTDGPLATATFSRPTWLATDGRGHLFVAEFCLVREIDLVARTVRTVVGPRTFANWEEVTACANADFIGGLSSDGDDRLFVSRTGHHVIEEVHLSTGSATDFLGIRDEPGTPDSTGTRLLYPGAVMFVRHQASFGEQLFIADNRGLAIRSAWGPSGLNLAWTPAPGRVVAFAAVPTAYVFSDVYALLSTGVLLNRLESGTGESRVLSGVQAAAGLAVTAGGEAWVSDFATGVVYRRLDEQYAPVVFAGKLGGNAGVQDGIGADAQLTVSSLSGLAVSSTGDVFLSDPSNHLIRKVEVTTGRVSTAFQGVTTYALAVDDEFLYAMENGRLRRTPLSGGGWQDIGGAPIFFNGVRDMVTDGHGTLWLSVSDAETFKLQSVRVSDGAVTTLLSTTDYHDAFGALAVTGEQLYVVSNDRVDVVSTQTGARRAVMKASMVLGGLAWDGSGKLYASAERQPVVLQFDLSTNTLTTLVGKPGEGAVVPGSLDSARVHGPAALATLPSGDVLVADARENVLLVVH